MNIISLEYTLNIKSLDIYVSGCKGKSGIHCKGCHNPSTWNFNIGKDYTSFFEKIENYIKDYNNLIDNIMIFGGEPLDQDINDLTMFLDYLKRFNKDIWLFTRYDYNEVSEDILNRLDYIKCGEYLEDLKVDDNIQYGIKLATSNQKIYKIN